MYNIKILLIIIIIAKIQIAPRAAKQVLSFLITCGVYAWIKALGEMYTISIL